MAAALDAAGLSKGTGHASLASQPSGKPAWDRRTRQPALSRHQSAFAASESTHGRSSLHPQHSIMPPERSHVSFVRQHSSLAGSIPHDQQHARSRLAEPHTSLQPVTSSAAGYAAVDPNKSGLNLRSIASQSHDLHGSPNHHATAGTALQRHKSQAAGGRDPSPGAPEHRQVRARQLNSDLRRPSANQKSHLIAASLLTSKAGGSVRSSGSFMSAQAPGNVTLPMQNSAGSSPTMLDLLQPSSANTDVSACQQPWW